MGAVVCSFHGRSGLASVCPHIAHAIRSRTQVPTWTSYPYPNPTDAYVVLRFCPACVAQRNLPVPGRTLSDDEMELDRFATDPVCDACFVELTSDP